MKRRNFIKKGALSGSFLALGGLTVTGLSAKEIKFSRPQFQVNYAPNPGVFEGLAGNDPVDQLSFLAELGFTAFEDYEMRLRPLVEQERIAKVIRKGSIRMGAFVAHTIYWTQPNLTSGNREWREEFLNEIRNSVIVAKRLNAKWMIVVPGYSDHTLNKEEQTVNVIKTLKQAAAILEPEELIMVLEPLNFYNDPGLFLTGFAQAYEICKAVQSPSCKMLFDISHQQINRRDQLSDIELYRDEIAYFQVSSNFLSGLSETGKASHENIFSYILRSGYQGVVGITPGYPIAGKAEIKTLLNTCKAQDRLLY